MKEQSMLIIQLWGIGRKTIVHDSVKEAKKLSVLVLSLVARADVSLLYRIHSSPLESV